MITITNDNFEDAKQSLGAAAEEEYETHEDGDGAVYAPAPLKRTVDQMNLNEADSEVYAQILDYARDELSDIASQDRVDPEDLQNALEGAVSNIVGDANAAIGRMEADRDKYHRAANELAEGLYATTMVAEELGESYNALEDAVDYAHHQSVRSADTMFGNYDSNEDTVREIHKFTEEITGEDPSLGLLEGSDSKDSRTGSETSKKKGFDKRRGGDGSSGSETMSVDQLDVEEANMKTANVEELNKESDYHPLDPRGWF